MDLFSGGPQDDITKEVFTSEDIEEFCSNLADLITESFTPIAQTLKSRGCIEHINMTRNALSEAKEAANEMTAQRAQFYQYLPELVENAQKLEELYGMIDQIEQEILPAVSRSVSDVKEGLSTLEKNDGTSSTAGAAGQLLTKSFLGQIGLRKKEIPLSAYPRAKQAGAGSQDPVLQGEAEQHAKSGPSITAALGGVCTSSSLIPSIYSTEDLFREHLLGKAKPHLHQQQNMTLKLPSSYDSSPSAKQEDGNNNDDGNNNSDYSLLAKASNK
uniref:Uncharacterized protein n=1 Tax=Heterosigma akashiwo TaxID=2829 RepID=A0A6V2SP38_HETAK|mmetsp:Transcript_46770/g.68375  ORF Transcript_46770/g.68375 Transcript_46770/m.68375 type:complete len:272 (+) Transcript_46770:39-854(+)|eukprot:CAMPEP_0194580372 /NCGR_PEP_ID=MMETSP0292-20121207/14162_1 /TAXON_ID=39354 /ORGANISM="Heterosigma akashiwo, Strain CCMP2393" /LENGTH=271 /DNA_ID=CAMNT_0039433705 /DNA_START=172 /DNA_END=987 /DNA_ORIENTATION=+